MKRNKYINSFNKTSEFNNYIESAEPGFPNVALTKDDGNVHYTRTSPNDHLIYGEVVDVNGAAPIFKFNDNNRQKVTAHIDTLNGTFYVDASDMTGVTTPITNLGLFMQSTSNNVKSVKKFGIDTSSVTSCASMFANVSLAEYINLSSCNVQNVTIFNSAFSDCRSLKVLDLSGLDMTSATDNGSMFSSTGSLTDVYITYESTLNKLTNNLSSAGNNYIPSRATIHYNGTDYKWQNRRWTPQS